ncbi:transglycosylase SLT domain-containing protein [Candidatus Woesearchaeota archaeon]|nr:transglycosylase SLT domain-containing protein [Candidatus Woesearchaeota archaeon]
MRKIKSIYAFLVLIILTSVYAQTSSYPSDKSLEERRNWLRENLKIETEGNNFKYNPSTNTLTISDLGVVRVPENFNGNVEITQGSIVIANKGTLTTLKDGGATFSNGKFTIKGANVLLYNYATPIRIENSQGVTFGGNQISGTCSQKCSVANQQFGQGTVFVYRLEEAGKKHKIALNTDPKMPITIPTLPNGDIRQVGSKIFLGDSNIELDANSRIFMEVGSKLTINGREITAKNKNLLLTFKEEGRVIKPKISDYVYEPNVNLRTDSKSKQYSAEAGYLVDEPRRVNSRNNLNNNPKLRDFISDQAKAYGVDFVDFVFAICAVESSCTPKTGCNRKSCGMFQISEIAVKDVNRFAGYKKYSWENVKDSVTGEVKLGVRDDPYKNAAAAIEYLAYLQRLYKGDKILAAAAYNAGLGNVNRYRGVPPFPITKAYVSKVNAYTTNKPILEKK